ncbi:MAG: hypothetical protein J6M39_08100 [Lachnospiraceae bacterium]|nr:hypothetical protein [Lachnospiraceae bacterium]
MSAWDYVMPHRLLINKSLRKAAEDLHARLDEYQIEYDGQLEKCLEELKRVEGEYQEKCIKYNNSLEEELQKERSILESVAQDITSYVDEYLHRNCLFQMRDIKRKQIKILKEDNSFLSSQMVLISREVDYFRKIQNELTSFTDVKDIIKLISLSGYEINSAENDNAKDLLDKVSQAISNCECDQNNERFALVRLKGIIQERSEYLPAIKYISWVIQQKIQFSRQISDKRKSIRDAQKDIWQEIGQIENGIVGINKTLEEIAWRIRYYWARPITYLNADISYAYKEKNVIENKLSVVGEELHNMASRHSDDQDRWNKLDIERIELLLENSSLKINILSNKNERKQWLARMNYIFQLCKKYKTPLIRKEKKETDEERIIDQRLTELALIRDKGIAEAKEKYNKKRLKIMARYYEEHTIMEFKLISLEKEKQELENEYKKISFDVFNAELKAMKIYDEDNRFLLVKIFNKTSEFKAAQKNKLSLKNKLLAIKKEKLKTETKVLEMNEKLEELDKNYKKELKKCVLVVSRPTKDESYEEEKLIYRKREIMERCKKGGSY